MKLSSKLSKLFLFTLVLPQLLMAAKIVDRTVVVVNDEVILESDVDKFLERMKSKSFQELFGGVDPVALKDRNKVLQLLIEERLINQQVKKLELQATDQEVEAQIKSIAKRNGITLGQLEERIKQLGSSMNEYKEGIKRQIERKNLVDREIKPSLEITEEQLRHYYLRNANPGDTQTEFKIAHILLARKKGALAPEARMKEIYETIRSRPEEFGKFAKEYSDDSSSAEADGVLGYFNLSSLSKEFRSVVPKTAVGQVTPPIKTSAGLHIVKVLDTRAQEFGNIPKEQRDMARSKMLQEEMEKKMGLWLERKKNEAHIRTFNPTTTKN